MVQQGQLKKHHQLKGLPVTEQDTEQLLTTESGLVTDSSDLYSPSSSGKPVILSGAFGMRITVCLYCATYSPANKGQVFIQTVFNCL